MLVLICLTRKWLSLNICPRIVSHWGTIQPYLFQLLRKLLDITLSNQVPRLPILLGPKTVHHHFFDLSR